MALEAMSIHDSKDVDSFDKCADIGTPTWACAIWDEHEIPPPTLCAEGSQGFWEATCTSLSACPINFTFRNARGARRKLLLANLSQVLLVKHCWPIGDAVKESWWARHALFRLASVDGDAGQ
jgi:hypothetical protein